MHQGHQGGTKASEAAATTAAAQHRRSEMAARAWGALRTISALRTGAWCGAATVLSHVAATGNHARCNDEEEKHMVALIESVSWPAERINDLKRANVGEVLRLMSVGSGLLSKEPPDGGTMAAVLNSIVTGSTLAGDAKWPDSTSTEVEEQTKWTQVCTEFTMLCRPAQAGQAEAVERMRKGMGAPRSEEEKEKARVEKEELEKRAHKARVQGYAAEARALYNRDFELPCDTATVLETKLAFDANTLRLARVGSGKDVEVVWALAHA